MKKEGTIGAAAFLAIAAVVGISWQSSSKPEAGRGGEQRAPVKRQGPASKKNKGPELGPGCQSIEEELREFLDIKDNNNAPIAPKECYEPNSSIWKEIPPQIAEKTAHLRFVIATVPDPLHTHLSVLFDQFTVAIQEAAQDEKYEFDSSWLPWEDEPESYALLLDQEAANLKKELRENQPGILLFRSARESQGSGESYPQGLVVFIVGEEATHGIHKDQFRNALAWIRALEPGKNGPKNRLGILGPTFSGSLPSLTQALADSETSAQLSLYRDGNPLAIFSGSVSGKESAEAFQARTPGVSFHSFVQNDNKILERFCTYITTKQPGFDPRKLAVLSEDETAYGTSGIQLETPEKETHPDLSSVSCPESAIRLYYPRDISALRGAYQTKSLFDASPGFAPADSQRRSLPTDLADPAGKVHDSIRSYGGNQSPLVQEAFLLEVVAALRDLHTRHILLRGSNTLDQLFLANFLRRMYPSGRIVILSSDLLFIRERGATGLNGAMTLTNYPLFPLARDWTEHEQLPGADRVFSSDTSEGTYIAFRVLLHAESLSADQSGQYGCRMVGEPQDIFVPPVVCKDNPLEHITPIPDYLPPYWMVPDDCTSNQLATTGCKYSGPATWLTVIGINRFWPVASLTDDDQEKKRVDDASSQAIQQTPPENHLHEPGRFLEFPPGMKVLFLILAGLAIFHAWCCWAGSYTAKPNFRAHFASSGDWRHAVLVFAGSCILAFMAIVVGSGCGAFSFEASGFTDRWPALSYSLFICFVAWGSTFARNVMLWRLTVAPPKETADLIAKIRNLLGQIKGFFVANGYGVGLSSILFLAALLAFFGGHVLQAEQLQLLGENDRALTYWRAMHLTSGVSPIVPFIAILAGLYVSFWLTLHGLALFGTDRPCLPSKEHLRIRIKANGKNNVDHDFLRMFSQEDAAEKIEEAARPLTAKTGVISASFFAVLLIATLALADGASLRGLGVQYYARILMIWLAVCISLQLAGAWRLYELWEELRRLLSFLDRLPLRRTLAAMHGFSWSSVWKMSGNVLEVRYKVISRQMESMNHCISTLGDIEKNSKDAAEVRSAKDCLKDLGEMRNAGFDFARWYCTAYTNPRAGDLTAFAAFQKNVALATGTLLTHLLIPAWRKETDSLILLPMEYKPADKEGSAPSPPPQAKEPHIRNAEEFVCLTYLGFIQNVLGRLRTLCMTIMALFLASTLALSTYPFDPRQVLSAILIVLFLVLGIVIVKVYAEMHRDATLSHVTNTKPGELGPEFWFKVAAFGLAPLAGLLTRIFPGIGDFILSWIQPGISSLK